MRIERNVSRGPAIEIVVDGVPVVTMLGETVATALLASDHAALRRDGRGRPRGLFCNMGTCCECFVSVAIPPAAARRVRACLTPVRHGMAIGLGDADA